MSIINNGLLLAAEAAAAGGYQISRSLRFNSADSAYLSRTPGSAGNRKTWTWSGWVKRSGFGGNRPIFGTDYNGASYFSLYFDGNNTFFVEQYSGSFQIRLQTTQVFRDPSAWYHVIVAVDTTQATASNRARIYVNGSEVTTFAIATYPSQNADLLINNNQYHEISTTNSSYAFNGYLADIHFIDGQALTPSSFAETDATTGQWVPKAYTGSYGTNGFRLTFSDNSGTSSTTLGKDAAGSNNWTPNNFSVASGSGNDSLVDSPSSYGTDTGAGGEVRGNYATWNPLTVISTVGPGTLSNGNLDVSISGAKYTVTTILIRPDTGSYYWEVNSNGGFVAIYDLSNANTIAFSSYVQTQLNGLVGVALNSDTGAYTIYLNGSVSSSGTLSDPAFAWAPAVTGNGYAFTLNAGQRPFAYTAPSGFKALCDTNLPTPTIAKPSTVMDVKLYTGNGSTQTVSGLWFSPDFVWFKLRSSTKSHALYDVIRGGKAYLRSDGTVAEQNYSTGGITAFNSDGFTIVEADDVGINVSSGSQVAWAWDAGSSTVTNTQGSITSQVRANASAGFSVVTYPGTGSQATIGHGLNAAPGLIIAKRRDSTSNWDVYHSSLGKDNTIFLNSTGAVVADSNHWGTSTPNSTVFGAIGAGAANNAANGSTQVAYCFAPVAGYSSFGSYTGNGSADGPFVFTGHRSRFLMIKKSSNAGSWIIWDSARDNYNYFQYKLGANLSSPENDAATIGYTYQETLDSCSNGFKLRSNNQFTNTNGETYIFASFAESPFQYARAR